MEADSSEPRPVTAWRTSSAATSANTSPLGWYSRVNSTAPFSSKDGPATVAVRHEVDADERRSGRACRGQRQLARVPRRIRDGLPDPAERDVRTPLAFRGDPEDRTDHAPRCHEDAKVIALRLHELLDEHALLLEPRRAGECREGLDQLVLVVAPRDALTAAPEARLDHNRRSHCRKRVLRPHVDRPRVRQPGPPEEASGEELVVRREERRCMVEHRHAASLERAERP